MEKLRIRDPGWKRLRSGIRDKHPGSATLKIIFFFCSAVCMNCFGEAAFTKRTTEEEGIEVCSVVR
jgi:hypothetical protein